MHVPDDLDPQDRDTRTALIRTLHRIRDVDNITVKQVADRIGVAPAAVRNLEKHHNWQGATIMRHARALNWRIEWLINGLDLPADDDIMAIVIAAGDTSTPQRQDAVHWRNTWNNLRRIRRHQLSAVAMATRLGVTDNAVHHLETNPEGTAVISAQRHTRALGGRLGWKLSPTRYAGRPILYTDVMP
jgi:DNA-binding XRE family transcriptional regulator